MHSFNLLTQDRQFDVIIDDVVRRGEAHGARRLRRHDRQNLIRGKTAARHDTNALIRRITIDDENTIDASHKGRRFDEQRHDEQDIGRGRQRRVRRR